MSRQEEQHAIAADEKRELIEWDRRYVWHPFTQHQLWNKAESIVIVAGEGEYLIDADGKRYIDGHSSLWCNIHGHRRPEIDAAIADQLERVAHSTQLGLASPPAIRLAKRLVEIAPQGLSKVFFSDDGSTSVEVACKLARGYWHHRGQPKRDTFIALKNGYHGDTIGAVSLGGIDLFHHLYKPLLFKTEFGPSPYCYRCPLGGETSKRQNVKTSKVEEEKSKSRKVEKSKQEIDIHRRDANRFPTSEEVGHPPEGESRKSKVESRNTGGDAGATPEAGETPAVLDAGATPEKQQSHELACAEEVGKLLECHCGRVAAVIVEPLVQCAAGIICAPPGYLTRIRELCNEYDTLLIADEVATGFGRTGRMFACDHEGVTPDLLCLSKGLTGGYMPLAATLTTEAIYEAFLGPIDSGRTFYHGHTFTGNPLACAAALASLDVFAADQTLERLPEKIECLAGHLARLAGNPHVGDVRQCGMIAGVEIVKDKAAAEQYPYGWQVGAQICARAAIYGVIIRPLADTIIIMPPLSISMANLNYLLETIERCINEVVPNIQEGSCDGLE